MKNIFKKLIPIFAIICLLAFGGIAYGITPYSIFQGGTGASTAVGARSNLGLGTIATENVGTLTNTKYCTYSTASGFVCNSEGTGSMTYPGAGVAVSDGGAWATSLSTDGSGDCAAGAACLGAHTHSSYLTSLSGAVLTDQTAGQTIGADGTRLTKLWATDITVTNAISGAITGNAGTASALAANGANCNAGESPLGIDASGAVEGCFAVVTGTPWTGMGYLTAETGDVSAVGDCATGACLDGTSDGGTNILFYDAQGATTLSVGDNTGAVVLTLPITTGTLALTTDTVAKASALAADPSDCAAGTAATAIAANGNLTCSITPLISGGTLTSANVCQYDGTGIDCDLTKDGSGDCASGAVCLGDHTHSGYQAADADLTTWAGITPGANVGTFLATPSSANFTAALTDEDGTGTCGTGVVCIGGHTHPTTEVSGVNAGTDLTADLEEEAHAAEHAVSAADTVFPADPNADRYLQWDDDSGVLVWAAGAGGLASTDIDTSAELLAIVGDETGSASGTPLLVFNTNPILTGATLAGILADNDDMVFEADADNNGSNKFSFTDGASGEIASITEAGLLTVADDIVITGSDLSLGAAGVKLTGDGDGAITFLGMGNGFDEDFTFNLDDVENTLTLSSSTGLATIDFGSMALTIGEGKLADSTIVSADVKDNTLTAGDMADSLDFGGDTSFEIPNAAGPTVDAAGEIAVDTTSDQLIYYGAAKRVIPYVQQKCISLETPVDADDNIPVFFPRKAITITDVYCEVDGGTSVAMTLSDGTNALEAITCDADGAEDDGSIANGTFTSLERMEFDLASTSGTNTWLAICISYVETAD